jgi:hypothetical protein
MLVEKSVPNDSIKFSPEAPYACIFYKIGQNLDVSVEQYSEPVLREVAGMNALHDTHNVLIIHLFKSFIPTIGIDLNVTTEKKLALLKGRFNWSTSFDEKKCMYLLSIAAQDLGIKMAGNKEHRLDIYDILRRPKLLELTDEQKEWVLSKLKTMI